MAGKVRVQAAGQRRAGQRKTSKIPAFRLLVEKLRNLRGWDLADGILFAALAVLSFFCFQQRDLMHTVGCSVGYLNGHFADFYDYCGTFGIHPSYLPSVYLVFAVWNIPM